MALQGSSLPLLRHKVGIVASKKAQQLARLGRRSIAV
jgi:hypothetical protein